MQYASTFIEVPSWWLCASLTSTCGTEHTCASIITFVCRLCRVCFARLTGIWYEAHLWLVHRLSGLCARKITPAPPCPTCGALRAVVYIKQYLPLVLSCAKEDRMPLLCLQAFHNTCGRPGCFQKIALSCLQCFTECRGSVCTKVCMIQIEQNCALGMIVYTINSTRATSWQKRCDRGCVFRCLHRSAQ